MATLSEVRAGLADRLRTIAGLRVYDQWPSEAPQRPCAIVAPGRDEGFGDVAEHDLTLGGGDSKYYLQVLLLMEAGDLRSAQRALDPYLAPSGTSSVRAAIYADDRLAGQADFCEVRGARDYGGVDVAGGTGFGATIPVEVWCSG